MGSKGITGMFATSDWASLAAETGAAGTGGVLLDCDCRDIKESERESEKEREKGY